MTSPPTTPQPPHTYTLPGVSHHPDYDITSISPSSHFQRTPRGDRLAPLSRLNSFRGRALASTTSSPEPTSPPPNLHLGAFDFEKEDTPEAAKTPRTYTVSHDTSCDFPTPETRPGSIPPLYPSRSAPTPD
ncbi:hypothetical protein GRF29_112g1374998 [Pseudopithomyces chartarum]|uniref:Uncharacterized protein n=1 Tax=Pseudopithomyces chartarum TaxID=1892770 RepID=A0AAN6LRY6_9PLEO|nr:hypothetical protein GRF29_112g1374998 [Pseudopithomyces chartarum]